MNSTCSVCKRPLKDPDSQRNGVGPICARKGIKQQRMLVDDGFVPTRALFDYRIERDVLIIKDMGSAISTTVTNDAESVLRLIQKREPGHDLTKFRIIYRDSKGQWDGMRWDGSHVTFIPVGGTNEHEAIERSGRPS